MKDFKEYAFGGGSIGSYKPVADLGDTVGKSYHVGLNAAAEKKITQSDLDQIEKYADRLFAALKIDVQFTKHFMDRVNDARNIKQITVAELIRLFKQAYRRYGKKIAKMPDDANAVINDMKTNINLPFVMNYKKGEIELVAKTVMRKKNFTTSASSPKLNSARAFSIISKHLLVCSKGLFTPTVLPSSPIAAVPATATILPVLVARENPMTDSNGELDFTLSISYFIGFNFGRL